MFKNKYTHTLSFLSITFLFVFLSGFVHAQIDIQRYDITQTDDLKVQVRLGGDGIRGGGQILLVFEMSDRRKRRFDLNRTREEWLGGVTKTIEVTVVPAIQYRDIQRIGIEFHGSQGDFTQTQDDFDLAHLHVESRALSATTPIINGNRVTVFSQIQSNIRRFRLAGPTCYACTGAL